MFRKDKPGRGSVVADVRAQTAQAAELAQIPGQHRLADPRTNPAVREHADVLRDEQQRRLLDAEHRRTLRRYRVTDRRAADAEQALQILQQAKDAKNPARSVLALHRGRRAYMGLALGASVVLAGGAAMGVGEFAAELGAPRRIGYLAELGGTGLATIVISYRAHLAQHGGTVTGWRDRVLWALILGPLAASIAANLAGAGLVGVLCSIGAAAFALLGYVVGEASAEALQDQADRVTGADEAALRAVALGEDLFTPPTDREPTGLAPASHQLADEDLVRVGFDAARVQAWLADRGVTLAAGDISRALASTHRPTAPAGPGRDGGEVWASTLGQVTAAQVEAFLAHQDPDGQRATSSPLPGPRDDLNGVTPPPGEDAGQSGDGRGARVGHIDGDQDERAGHGDGVGRVRSAIAARRQAGQKTRQRIADYLADHPKANPGQIAAALDLSPSTVKRHRAKIPNR